MELCVKTGLQKQANEKCYPAFLVELCVDSASCCAGCLAMLIPCEMVNDVFWIDFFASCGCFADCHSLVEVPGTVIRLYFSFIISSQQR